MDEDKERIKHYNVKRNIANVITAHSMDKISYIHLRKRPMTYGFSVCTDNSHHNLLVSVEILIHSANPQSRPVVIIVFTHIFRSSVRPYVPTFQGLAKQNECQMKTMFITGETRGLAEWIIDDTCLVFITTIMTSHNINAYFVL